jgi:hypothetical protein
LIDYLNSHAETIILVVVLILAAVSIIVFLGAIYSRWILNLAKNKRRDIKEELSGYVVQYACGDLEFKELEKRLRTSTDHQILLTIINELSPSISGTERDRLQLLLGLPTIENYFMGQFKSKKQLEKAKACLYLSRIKSIDSKLFPTLLQYSAEEYSILSYASCMTIIVHGDDEQKRLALKNQLLNENLSDQALNDLFVEFQDVSEGDISGEAKTIMGFISEKSYSSSRNALLIRTLGELNYHESAEFLVNEFLQLPSQLNEPEVAETLITYMPVFTSEETESKILERLHIDYATSEFREVREATMKALGMFGKDESIPILKWALYDLDFYVRFYAAKSLHSFSGVMLSAMKPDMMMQDDWDDLVGEVNSLNSQL